MEINNTTSYEDMIKVYSNFFSVGYLNTDINTKFALISLVCYVTNKLNEKGLNVNHYQVLKKLSGDISDGQIKGIAVVCSDFSYGCKEFPTFGIEDKKIPAKIKEILSNWLPF